MIKRSLLALAIGGFGIGMTEFVIMGLLPDVAQNLQISIPEAGYLISAYALGVVVGAPILAGSTSKYSPKAVLMSLMLMFTVFNGLSALAPNYYLLMFARFCSGLPHGAFFGVGAVVASRLAEKGKMAQAVATMITGLTLANVFGVPVGTYLGHTYSWRLSFALIALIGLVTAFCIKLWIPEIPGNKEASLKADLKIFKKPNLWLSICITSIGFGGFFAWMSYIAPLLTREAGFASTSIPLMMTVAGLGMTCGNILGGKLADRFSPVKAIIVTMLIMTVLLIINGVVTSSPALIVVLTFLTGVCALAMGAPLQMLLIYNSKGAEILGSALGQTSFNIGNALGAYLGGIPLALGYSYSTPQFVGSLMSLMGAGMAFVLFNRTKGEKFEVAETPLGH